MEERVCAYIDILGFSNIIERIDKGEVEENFIEEAFDQIRHFTTQSHNVGGQKLTEPDLSAYVALFENLHCSIFSDTIILTTRVEGNLLSAFHKISALSGILQAVLFLGHGILLRGAITHGRLKHDDKYLYGRPIVKAHILEKSVAVYPRIIVCRDLINELIDDGTLFSEEIFKIDQDGYYFYSLKTSSNDLIKHLEHTSLFGRIGIKPESFLQNRFREYCPGKNIDNNIFAKWSWLHNELFGEPL